MVKSLLEKQDRTTSTLKNHDDEISLEKSEVLVLISATNQSLDSCRTLLSNNFTLTKIP